MSTYEISKSSLLSLKAEILRKQEELTKAKADNEVKIRNLKKTAPLDLKNKGVEQRQAQDTSEDDDVLKRSREALEAKTKLYDKLSKNPKLTEKEAEYYRRYLVRFDRKSKLSDLPPEDSDDDVDREEEDIIEDNYEPPKNPDEEWVEYVDCLGRTRTCLRKDLQHIKEKDRDLKHIVDGKKRRDKSRSRSRTRSPTPEPPPKSKSKSPEPELTEDNELLSNDMRREMLRRQWEKEEEELRNKSNIHYQDILFNEARTHGVGYYGFSKDEEERAKQQEALNKLRQETQQQQKRSQELKAMREKQLAARILAAKNRKRERMGLPPLENEPEPTPEPEKPPVEDNESEKNKEIEEKRKKHVRPWDIGKEGVKSHYEHTQEEWVDKKRRERPDEFAPPSSYHKDRRRRRDSDDYRRKDKKPEKKEREFRAAPIINELSDEETDSLLNDYRTISGSSKSKGAEVPPPPTYDYYGPTSHKRSRRDSISSDVSESIEAGLKFLREQIEKQSDKQKDIFYK